MAAFDCFNDLLLHGPKVQGLDYVTAQSSESESQV